MEERSIPTPVKLSGMQKDQDEYKSSWLSEAEVTEGFTPLQLDVFHALWNLNHPNMPTTLSMSQRKRTRLSRAQALQLFPTATMGIKTF